MIRRLRQIFTALAAMAIAVVLLVAVPVALIRSVGWPLPTTWPTLDELARTAQIGIADATVIKALAVIVWLAWTQIATAIVVETVAFARRTAARRLPLLPGLQPIAARLVATIALIAAATSTPRPGAMVVPLEAAVATAPQAMPAEAPTMDRPSPDARPARPHAETTVITTSNRDTWWRLAEQHLDDGLRWRELRDLNLDREVAPGTIIDAKADQLQAGWRLLIPTDGTEPAGATEGASDPAAGEWHVQRGDNFWHIAEQTLTDAWDRTPSDAEITPYWREIIEVNRDRLAPPGDPNLIHPGQRFITPRASADPLAGPSDTAAPTDQPEQAIDEGRPDPTPAEDGAAAVPEEAELPAGDWEAAIRRPATNVAPDHAEGDMHRQAPADQDDDARNALGVPANLPAGLAAAGLVGAGVVATLRWRRRAALRSRTPGYRLPTPLPEAAPQETRLQTAALPDRTLDDLVWLLASIPEDVHPALVTTTGDGTVMLLFDDAQPVPDPPDPWTLADDGTDGPVGWSATIGVRGPERSVGLPLLVTLGDAGPTTVYANVAAIGTMTIAGPDDAVRRRLQTMALEAATSRVALPLEVAVVGDDLLATLDQVRHVTELTPEIDAAVAEVERNIIRDDRTSRLLIAHDPDLAPAVPKSLVGTVGAIAPAGDHPTRWALQVNDDRTGRLRLPDGGQVDLALPHLDPTVADSELVRLDAGATIPMTDDPPAEPVAHPSTNGKPPVAAAARQPAWCEVRLLGPVQVHRDGQQLEDISPRTMEVLAYLATHRDGGVSKERLDDAVWAGKRAPPGSQRVIAAMTKLRQALGDGPDGQPLVPRRTKSDRIILANHVGCDLDRAYAHIALSRDLPDQAAIKELDAALALIRGQPLEDLPVSWASETNQRAVIELQQAALDAARAHRQTGDYDAAENAIRQGLKLHDPNDHLYLELAQVAAARGHPEQVDTIWRQLRKRHADEADEIAGSVSWPPREIELEFQRLEGPSRLPLPTNVPESRGTS